MWQRSLKKLTLSWGETMQARKDFAGKDLNDSSYVWVNFSPVFPRMQDTQKTESASQTFNFQNLLFILLTWFLKQVLRSKTYLEIDPTDRSASSSQDGISYGLKCLSTIYSQTSFIRT